MADTNGSMYDNPDKVLPADAAAAIVYDDYNRSKTELVDKVVPKLNELYKAYRAHVEKKDDLIQSNLVIPMALTQVEAFVARVIVNRPRIEVWPRGGQEDSPRATAHRVKLDYDWDHMDMPWKLVNFVKSALIYGTSWMKVRYRKETATRLVRRQELVPQTRTILGIEIPGGEPRLEMVESDQQVTIWDDPDVDCIELDEIFPDPDMKALDDPDGWVIHRYVISLNKLETMQNTDGEPLYDQSVVKELKKRSETNARSIQHEDSLRAIRDTISKSGGEASVDPHKRENTILEKWSDGKVVAICEEHLDLKPLRNERNRYGLKPFFIYTPIPDPNALLGISPVEILFSLQKEVSTLHNARMDHVMQTVHAMMTIRRGSNLNPKNIRVRPRGYAFVEEHDDINWLRPPALEFSLYREDDQLQMWAQKAGGATDTFVGVHGSQSGRTATEAALLSQSSGSRSGHMLKILTIQSLNRLGRILIRMNEVEMTAARQLPSINSKAQVFVSPEILNGEQNIDLDVRIDVAETEPETRLFKRKEALEAIQTLGQLYGPNHPLVQKFLVILAETYDGIDDAEKLAQVPAQQEQGADQPGAPGAPGGLGQELAAAFGGGGAPNAGDGGIGV
jgi:hypothetical protein